MAIILALFAPVLLKMNFDTILFRIALFLCCCLSSCHILRLPCKEVGEFSVIKENFALPGHVIATFPSLTAAECEHKCLLNNQCNSINTEKGDQTCELNSKAIIHLSTGENALVAKQNWIYKSTNYSETLVKQFFTFSYKLENMFLLLSSAFVLCLIIWVLKVLFVNCRSKNIAIKLPC